jgi:hypothetical protein
VKEEDMAKIVYGLNQSLDGYVFAGPRPPLRLVTGDRIAGDVMRLTYVPA